MFGKEFLTWCCASVLLMAGVAAAPVSADNGESFTLARAPQRSEIATIRDWQPLADYLSRELKSQVRLKTYSTRAEFEGSLVRGDPDLVFFSPYYHSVSHKLHGYVPLIRGSKVLKGVLVVRQDSDIQSVADLGGKIIAFPSPNAFAASLYMRALLQEREQIDFTPLYVETHDNVYRNVLVGRAAAGGGVVRTLNQETPALRDQLRIIYETPGTPSHPLSVHPRVPEALHEAVVAAFMKLQTTDEGRHLLARLKIRDPVRTDHTLDYGALGELGLERYGTFAP